VVGVAAGGAGKAGDGDAVGRGVRHRAILERVFEMLHDPGPA
jgi:hypothetical protein